MEEQPNRSLKHPGRNGNRKKKKKRSRQKRKDIIVRII